MIFIETKIFTKQITSLLSDEDYAGLQKLLIEKPDRGDLISGGGGIRKLRYSLPNRGKSGGIRIIYYWIKDDGKTYMLVAYPKSKKDNLTQQEVSILYQIVKDI